MKKLQNNFTNFNQIVRLQELGVPADCADMYIECYWCYGGNGRWRHKVGSHEIFRDRKQIGEGVGAIRPCWSVGRLIEIYEICTQRKFNRKQQTDDLVYLSPLEDVLMQIEHNACGFYDNTKWDTNLLNG